MTDGSLIPVEDFEVEGPAMEPIDLDETKRALNITTDSDDTLIDGWITGARQKLSRDIGRDFIRTTRELWLPTFPSGRIVLPRPPLLSVESLTYTASDGTATVLDPTGFLVYAPSGHTARCGWLELAYGGTWPTPQLTSVTVRIRYQTGYGDSMGAVPAEIRGMLYKMVGHAYKFRELANETGSMSEVPFGYADFVRNWAPLADPAAVARPPRTGLVTWG
jgi:uncharacterized phiE125 gp8 family phage protein